MVHVSHPHPIEWSRLFSTFAKVLGARTKPNQPLPVIPFKDWNARVNDAVSSFQGPEEDLHQRFPTTKIQATIDAMAAYEETIVLGETKDVEAGPTMLLDVSKGQRRSVTTGA